MLGWMLRRGEDAPAAGDGDTTQFDQPDTPAPVFAARAFKSALFGTPARPSDEPAPKPGPKPTMDRTNSKPEPVDQTPLKPQGILLTPGTGTSRRKRVSFGHDVKKTNAINQPKGLAANRHAKLDEALEKIRQRETKPASKLEEQVSEDEWEEDGEEDFCTHDVTVDLNEPHSQSGKYWKENFEKYHEDAKVQLEKMLRYKQLAKSYAKQKDAEAIDLAEKLKEEQRKVIEMEQKIAQGASQIASKRSNASDEPTAELLSTLAKQTALAVQYRTRVQELEDQFEEVLRERGESADSAGRRRRIGTSPRTQRTIMETQRELRKARNQVKELGELKDQVRSLKAQLKEAEQRATRAEAKESMSSQAPRENSRAQELRAQVREAKEESRKKDEELRQLRKEFDAFREETQKRDEDTSGVLARAHTKISELKKEIRTLKAGSTATDHASRPKSWHPEMQTTQPEDTKRERKRSSETTSRPQINGTTRRSFDYGDLSQEITTDTNLPTGNPQSLRQKFHDDAFPKITQSDLSERRPTPIVTMDRPTLDRPRWQPFVPRSPRNRAYLGADVARRIENGGITPLADKQREIIAPDLPSLAARISKPTSGEVDLLGDRFARLGGPETAPIGEASSFLGNTSKSTLPPQRRAAAIARIERRMAEKKRARGAKGVDKENVRP